MPQEKRASVPEVTVMVVDAVLIRNGMLPLRNEGLVGVGWRRGLSGIKTRTRWASSLLNYFQPSAEVHLLGSLAELLIPGLPLHPETY